ncbi:hypothetical protein K438DRAFT_416323 [Mycena galopus ATCC 62051]|nr:hypothetical protein K438DRAFT_416323 [Mycena galopus ATCC 62051]
MKNGNKSREDSRSSNWISNLQLCATALKASSGWVPCLQPVFEAVLIVLDLVERVGKNDTDLKYLAQSICTITALLTEELESRPESADVRLMNICADFVRYLDKTTAELGKIRNVRKPMFWFRKYLKAKSIRDTVDYFTRRLTDLRADLTLAAAVGSRFQISDTDKRVRDLQTSLTQLLPRTMPAPVPASDLPEHIQDDIVIFKPSELHLKFETAHSSVVTLRTMTSQNRVTVRMYNAKVNHAGVTTRVYDGEHAYQVWRKDLEMVAANLRYNF